MPGTGYQDRVKQVREETQNMLQLMREKRMRSAQQLREKLQKDRVRLLRDMDDFETGDMSAHEILDAGSIATPAAADAPLTTYSIDDVSLDKAPAPDHSKNMETGFSDGFPEGYEPEAPIVFDEKDPDCITTMEETYYIIDSKCIKEDINFPVISEIHELPGIGTGMIWRLKQIGIQSLECLAKLELDELKNKLGPVARMTPLSLWIDVARSQNSS